MKQKKDFALRQVCGMNIITAEGKQAIDFSKLINLNETATFLWEEAARQGEFTPESLAAALCKEYEVDEAQALKDCQETVDAWNKEGLLE